jgi:hypothetical protein
MHCSKQGHYSITSSARAYGWRITDYLTRGNLIRNDAPAPSRFSDHIRQWSASIMVRAIKHSHAFHQAMLAI